MGIRSGPPPRPARLCRNRRSSVSLGNDHGALVDRLWPAGPPLKAAGHHHPSRHAAEGVDAAAGVARGAVRGAEIADGPLPTIELKGGLPPEDLVPEVNPSIPKSILPGDYKPFGDLHPYGYGKRYIRASAISAKSSRLAPSIGGIGGAGYGHPSGTLES